MFNFYMLIIYIFYSIGSIISIPLCNISMPDRINSESDIDTVLYVTDPKGVKRDKVTTVWLYETVQSCSDKTRHSDNFFFYLYQLDYKTEEYKYIQCMVKDHFNCYMIAEFVYINIFIASDQTFVIRCSVFYQEVPFNNNPRLITNQRLIPTVQLVYPTDVLIFRTICINIHPQFLKFKQSGQLDCVESAFSTSCNVNLNPGLAFVSFFRNWTYTLQFQVITIDDQIAVRGRYSEAGIPWNYNPGPSHDLLEVLTCDAMSNLYKPAYYKTKLIYIRFTNFPSLAKYTLSSIRLTPDYNLTSGVLYEAECYLGKFDNKTNTKSFKSLSKNSVLITGTKISDIKLEDSNGFPIVAERNFEMLEVFIGSVVSCGTKKILAIKCSPCNQKAISTFMTDLNYPESPYILLSNVTKGTVLKSWSINNVYARCDYDIPLILDIVRPVEFDYIYVWPAYKPKYFLRGFVLGCYGINISSIEVVCLDCSLEQNFIILTVNSSYVEVQIPHDYQYDQNVIIRCSAIMFNNYKYHKDINITILTEFSLKYDETNLIITPGGPVNCRADVTIKTKNSTFVDNVKWPIFIRINKKTTLMSYTEYNYLPIVDINQSTLFEYCCPTLTAGQVIGNVDILYYVTCTNYEPLNAVWNYHIQFNVPLDLIYPTTILKCYFCVNFTIHPYLDAPCNKTNRISSKIDYYERRMDDGDEIIIRKHDVNEIHFPASFLLQSTTGFLVTDLEIKINCKIRDLKRTETIDIKVKDCKVDPPAIKVMPHDRSLLFVGDSVSCITDLKVCRGNLNYNMEINSDIGPQRFENISSLILLRYHMSYKLTVICLSGIRTIRSNKKFFRVEGPPQNIRVMIGSRNNIPGTSILTHGDFLECKCDGFPLPVYEWFLIYGPSEIRISLKYLLITHQMFSGEYRVKCQASNSHGQMEEEFIFYVYNGYFQWYEEESTYHIVILFIGLIVFIIVEIICVPFIWTGVYGYTWIIKKSKKTKDTNLAEKFDKSLDSRKRSVTIQKINQEVKT